jgi:GNAT superfamily N-acetyltransferase
MANYTITFELPKPAEVVSLFDSVGWGGNSIAQIEQSLAAYSCIISARTTDELLIAYASVFSDEIMTTMLGEFVVHPAYQRHGVGTLMLEALERRYPNAPIYIKAFGDSKNFYAVRGFVEPSARLTVMFKKPALLKAAK